MAAECNIANGPASDGFKQILPVFVAELVLADEADFAQSYCVQAIAL